MSVQVTYAVGDVHGRLDLTLAALRAIRAHTAGLVSKLVFLGDYVDRGPNSREVVELLIKLQQDPSVVCLKGNHEDLMVKALTDQGETTFSRWIENGGRETLRSYGASSLEEAEAKIPDRHVRWMKGLPLTSGDGQRVYVHAGLRPSTPFEKQDEESLLWIRERFLRADAGAFTEHVVHGHTPVWAGKPDPARPELLAHRTNLDTGGYYTGVLTVGVFPAGRSGGPEELIMVRASGGERPVAETVSAALFAAGPGPATPGRRSWRGLLKR